MERGSSERDFIRAWKGLRFKYNYCAALMKILDLIDQEEHDENIHWVIESLKCTVEADEELYLNWAEKCGGS